MNDLIEKTNELLVAMEQDLKSWYLRSEYCDSLEYADKRMEGVNYTFEEGRNYIKLVKTEKAHNISSVVGFIVKKSPKAIDNKTNKPFQVGDMLMAAGWNKPATNFARGNVFNLNPYAVRWTGI
jgi:hypothetical protein